MYIHNKKDLIEHPAFHQAIVASELDAKVKWLSLYRDKDGELVINFAYKLSKEQVKIILMHFKALIDGDNDILNVRCENKIDYMYSASQYNKEVKTYTAIYTPDGYNYSNF